MKKAICLLLTLLICSPVWATPFSWGSNYQGGEPAGGGSGAPTDADYLVGTANGDLSAEIVVGTSPGGELGGTWASPTIDDGLSVANWSFTESINIPNGTGPTTDAAGEVAFDTDAQGSGRGSLQIYDGTANTYAVAVLASDTCTNGQIPTWNTGGTWTCETAAGGSPGGSDTQMQFNSSGSFGGASRMTYNNTSHTLFFGGNAGDFNIKWDHSGTGNDQNWTFTAGELNFNDQNNNKLIQLKPASAGASNQGPFIMVQEANVVQATTTLKTSQAGKIVLNIKGFASQTADLFLVEDSAGTDLVAISPSGELKVADTNTGSNAGTDLCIDANNKICACGSCA